MKKRTLGLPLLLLLLLKDRASSTASAREVTFASCALLERMPGSLVPSSFRLKGFPRPGKVLRLRPFSVLKAGKRSFALLGNGQKRRQRKVSSGSLKAFPRSGAVTLRMSQFGSTVIKTTLSLKLRIHVTKAPPRKRKVSDEFQVKGPPKKFFLKNETSEKAKLKVIDLEDMEVEEGHEDPESDEG